MKKIIEQEEDFIIPMKGINSKRQFLEYLVFEISGISSQLSILIRTISQFSSQFNNNFQKFTTLLEKIHNTSQDDFAKKSNKSPQEVDFNEAFKAFLKEKIIRSLVKEKRKFFYCLVGDGKNIQYFTSRDMTPEEIDGKWEILDE